MTDATKRLITLCGGEVEFCEAMFSNMQRIYSYMKEYDLADANTYDAVIRKAIPRKLAGGTGFHAAIRATCGQKGVSQGDMAAYFGQGYEKLIESDTYLAERIFSHWRISRKLPNEKPENDRMRPQKGG